MPVKVIIPTPLRQYADKKESLEVEAKTVGDVSFEREAFMKIALEESEVDGTA